MPTSGPWAKLGELVDWVREVKPSKAIQIHDLMLSDAGRGSFAQFSEQLTGLELVTLADGDSVEV